MKREKILGGAVILALVANFLPLAFGQGAKSESFNLEDAVIQVASTAGRAVVSISTEHTAKIRGQQGRRFYFRSPSGESPFGEDEFFRRFFDDFFGELPDREYKQSGLGSGVIIDPQGYILTNEHVIRQCDALKYHVFQGETMIPKYLTQLLFQLAAELFLICGKINE